MFLILLIFVVCINTSVFNRTIIYMIIFINNHMTYLIFTKFFKCFEIFVIFRQFLKLLLIFVMNFSFVNIFYLNNVSFDVENVKAVNGAFSLTIMAEDF